MESRPLACLLVGLRWFFRPPNVLIDQIAGLRFHLPHRRRFVVMDATPPEQFRVLVGKNLAVQALCLRGPPYVARGLAIWTPRPRLASRCSTRRLYCFPYPS